MEPQEKPDPYANWTKHSDQLKKEIAELHTIRDPGKLADKIRKLLKDGVSGKPIKEVQFYVLHEGLPLAANRVNEAFTVELLSLVPASLGGTGGPGAESADMPEKQGELLQRSLQLAGHFNREEIVKKLVDDFVTLVHSKPEEMRFKLINVAAGQCVSSLKKLGLQNDIDRFLVKLHGEVLRGQSSAELKKKYAAKPELWAQVLQTQLNLARGWLNQGIKDRAEPIIQEARGELLNQGGVNLQSQHYTHLARSYVTTLGQMQPAEQGLALMLQLFNKMDPKKITNTFTTAQFYSRLHLNLVEDVIKALVSDDSGIGTRGQRWLEDDEYLVRKRIHGDMKRYLETSNLH
jgi:hypothetical protein